MKAACDICEQIISMDDREYSNWAKVDIKDSNPYGKDLHYRICTKCVDKLVEHLNRVVSA